MNIRPIFAIAALTALAVGAGAAPRDETPQQATTFYMIYMKSNKDGVSDAKLRAKFKPHISAALEQLLADGDKAERAHFKATKNEEPPLVEGDLFTSNFEGATSFKLGDCTGDMKSSRCFVSLTYDDRKNHAQDKPVTWSDTVFLVMERGCWRVDDIAYGGTWDFGNKGRLSETLKAVIKEANQ